MSDPIARGALRKKIVDDVLFEHGVTEEEFFGRRSAEDIVDARRDAAKRLKALDFKVCAIGRILKRDHATINHYLDPKYTLRKRNRMRAVHGLKKISRDVADIVAMIADAEGVSPAVLAAEWIAERATYEIEAKAREAA